jgi:hypothetical protein
LTDEWLTRLIARIVERISDDTRVDIYIYISFLALVIVVCTNKLTARVTKEAVVRERVFKVTANQERLALASAGEEPRE